MKSFRQYLAESFNTYRYKVKIAGDCDSKLLDMLRMNLKKFDPVKISDARTTPVQKSPYGFPQLTDMPVTIIDCEFKYPATEPMIRQMARLLGIDENRVRVIQSDFDDSIDEEAKKYAEQASPVLEQPDMPDNGKEASKAYARQYLDQVVPQKPTFDIPYAAEKTRPAQDTRKTPGNNKSPMTNVYRPAKPATGAIK